MIEILLVFQLVAYKGVEPDPVIKKWIEGLSDKSGRGCCSTADGHIPDEIQYDIRTGKYWVFISDGWYIVPDDALIESPNMLGKPMVWWRPSWENGIMIPVIRCFIPGAGI